MKAIIADTGPLYGEVDRNDQYHSRFRSELKKFNQEKLAIIVPYPIFLEAHKLILYSGGLKAALSFSERLVTQTNLLNPTSDDYQEALELIARFTDQSITFFDGVTATLARKINLPVWTYDYHFDVMGIQVWR